MDNPISLDAEDVTRGVLNHVTSRRTLVNPRVFLPFVDMSSCVIDVFDTGQINILEPLNRLGFE